MSQKKKSVALALTALVAGVAAMPVTAFVSTVLGLTLASLSIAFTYMAS